MQTENRKWRAQAHDRQGYAKYGLRTGARPEQQIDEDEEAREAEWDLWESMKEASY